MGFARLPGLPCCYSPAPRSLRPSPQALGSALCHTAWWQVRGQCLSLPSYSLPHAVNGVLKQFCLRPDMLYRDWNGPVTSTHSTRHGQGTRGDWAGRQGQEIETMLCLSHTTLPSCPFSLSLSPTPCCKPNPRPSPRSSSLRLILLSWEIFSPLAESRCSMTRHTDGPWLMMVQFRIFQFYQGKKAMHMQWKSYFEFWSFPGLALRVTVVSCDAGQWPWATVPSATWSGE